MKRILLTIAYDGTNYSGWQKQKDEAVITVEGELTKALRLLFRNPALECIGASRTPDPTNFFTILTGKSALCNPFFWTKRAKRALIIK